ncbi:hypothetical protein JVT61DRAFT_13430 [Boletus reticuloceps]|uniref:C2H2-type domain-containing protein n=1 Tax=Boletus reticuloceps TaxID=495285 RepID=A0A8I2YDL4_9AGAM|nr:hypothetical protein JVT61DRAFT_13430 [Boletus reticuloceps]
MSNAEECSYQGCLDPSGLYDRTAAGERRHRYQYHLAPVPFAFEGKEVAITVKDGRIICPLGDCDRGFARRDRIQTHLHSDHMVPKGVKFFGDPKAGEKAPAVVNKIQQSLRAPSAAPSGSPTRVVLQPGQLYLLGGGILDVLGLWLHPALSILLCRECRVALTSQMVPGHRKVHHGETTSPKALAAFTTFCEEKRVFNKPEQVTPPQPGGPPVEGISGPVDGFSCTVDKSCLYSVKDYSSMQRHNREKHKGPAMGEIRSRSTKVQTLFTGVGRVYFEVSPLAASAGQGNLKAAVTRALPALHEADEGPLPAVEDREPPPLIRAMDWDNFHPELRADRRTRDPVIALKDRHKENEHSGIFVRLQRLVVSYTKLAASCLDGHPQKLTATKVLVYGRAIPATG